MYICENDHFICNNLVIYHLCNERTENFLHDDTTRKKIQNIQSTHYDVRRMKLFII